MGVRAALAVLLLFAATVKAGDGGVTFWWDTVTMTCPGNGIWFDKVNKEIQSQNTQLEFKYESNTKGLYSCKHDDDNYKYYFYIQGKGCPDCIELDAALFLGAVCVDTFVMALVSFIIYRCTKRRSSAGFTHTSKAPARSGGRAPPVPSPDYEQLNPHTRSQGTYSVVNRTG